MSPSNIQASNSKAYQNWIRYIFLFFIAAFYLLIFAGSTSPLYKDWYGADSPFFMMVGAGMKKGLLPYRDFFDQKGPYLFFIQYIGQLISDGRLGCFIMELINLFVILVFVYKTFDLLYDKKRILPKLLMLMPLLIYLSGTFQAGNLTEEYCNSFVFISLYFFFKHITKTSQDEAHPPFYAFIYGLCFGVISFIRIDNNILICAIVLTILIFEVKNKHYKNILQNVAYGVAGVLISWIPMLVFYALNGELGNMLYNTFIIAFRYSQTSIGNYFYFISFLPSLCIPAVCSILVKDKQPPRLKVLCFVSSIMYVLYFSMHNRYIHYFETALPLILIGTWTIIFALNSGFSLAKPIKKLMIIGIVCASLAAPLSLMAITIKNSYARLSTDITAMEIKEANEITEMIPSEDRTSIYVYNVQPRWYSMTGVQPISKYCAWQERYSAIIPNVAEEIDMMFEEQPPLYVVTDIYAAIKNMYMKKRLDNEYEQYFKNDAYVLYKRIN